MATTKLRHQLKWPSLFVCTVIVVLLLFTTSIYFRNSIFYRNAGFATWSVYKEAGIPSTQTEGGIWVNPPGNFTLRVAAFNRKLSGFRNETLTSRGDAGWRDVEGTHLELVLGGNDGYLQRVLTHPHLHTVFLAWAGTRRNLTWDSRTDAGNVLVQNYFRWAASEPLCTWMTTQVASKAKYAIGYNFSCNTDVSLTKRPSSMEILTFHAKPMNPKVYLPPGGILPSWYLTMTPDYVTYIHVIQDAVITAVGDVISQNTKLVPYTCSYDTSLSPPAGYRDAALHDEVFVLSQYWGESFFHRLLETMPKVAPYLKFLADHPDIKIQVPVRDALMKSLFTVLGLQYARAVTGTLRAKVSYVPRASGCGLALVQETQLFSRTLRQYTVTHLLPGPRNKLVLIQRSNRRHFTHRADIQDMVEKMAADYGLVFNLWSDSPVKPLEEGMRLFHEAVMVVAPHGAGESNLLFSQPATYVIEAVCNQPHVNLCYQRVAYVLGQHYHAIPSRGGCEAEIQVSSGDIQSVIKIYLDDWKTLIR